MSVTGAVARLQTLSSGLTGMRLAPNYPPEQANAFPFAISYIDNGRLESARLGSVLSDGYHVLATEIHVARRDLPTAIESAEGFLALFVTALQGDPTLNSQVMIIERMNYTFGALQYGGVDTIGYRFLLDIRTDEC
jgi:hypothetical protein